jgi:DNA polymerase/3'-5' exonuclease PolX
MDERKKILKSKEKIIEEDVKKHNSFLFDLVGLMSVPGINSRRAAYLYIVLRIKNIYDLYQSCVEGELEKVNGFGKRRQEEIKNNIELLLVTMMGQCNKIKKDTNSPYQPKVVDKLFLLELVKEISKSENE